MKKSISFIFIAVCLAQVCLAQVLNLESEGYMEAGMIIGERLSPAGYILEIQLEIVDSNGQPNGYCVERYLKPISKRKDLFICVTELVSPEGEREEINPYKGGTYPNGYMSHSLQYYSVSKTGLVKVKVNGNYHLIKKTELSENGFFPRSWKKHMTNDTRDNFTVNVNLNLRARPNISTDKLALLKINQPKDTIHLFRFTGKFEGNWAEVSYYKGYDDYCSRPKKVMHQITGWIKYMDDAEFPNVYVRGMVCC